MVVPSPRVLVYLDRIDIRSDTQISIDYRARGPILSIGFKSSFDEISIFGFERIDIDDVVFFFGFFVKGYDTWPALEFSQVDPAERVGLST